MNIVAIIQARMGSTRLPGKVLMGICGKPMLELVLNRCQRAKSVNRVIVATTHLPSDDLIVSLSGRLGISVFRGSEEDVLDRYYQAALAHKADIIVRVTSDCPLIDPEIIDRVVSTQVKESSIDYVSTSFPSRTFPRGLDVEAMTFQALERVWAEDTNPLWREHVTPYLYRHPAKFALRSVVNDYDCSHLRLTVDTEEDLTLVRKIYEAIGRENFFLRDVLNLLKEHPDWLNLNRHIVQKEVPWGAA